METFHFDQELLQRSAMFEELTAQIQSLQSQIQGSNIQLSDLHSYDKSLSLDYSILQTEFLSLQESIVSDQQDDQKFKIQNEIKLLEESIKECDQEVFNEQLIQASIIRKEVENEMRQKKKEASQSRVDLDQWPSIEKVLQDELVNLIKQEQQEMQDGLNRLTILKSLEIEESKLKNQKQDFKTQIDQLKFSRDNNRKINAISSLYLELQNQLTNKEQSFYEVMQFAQNCKDILNNQDELKRSTGLLKFQNKLESLKDDLKQQQNKYQNIGTQIQQLNLSELVNTQSIKTAINELESQIDEDHENLEKFTIQFNQDVSNQMSKKVSELGNDPRGKSLLEQSNISIIINGLHHFKLKLLKDLNSGKCQKQVIREARCYSMLEYLDSIDRDLEVLSKQKQHQISLQTQIRESLEKVNQYLHDVQERFTKAINISTFNTQDKEQEIHFVNQEKLKNEIQARLNILLLERDHLINLYRSYFIKNTEIYDQNIISQLTEDLEKDIKHVIENIDTINLDQLKDKDQYFKEKRQIVKQLKNLVFDRTNQITKLIKINNKIDNNHPLYCQTEQFLAIQKDALQQISITLGQLPHQIITLQELQSLYPQDKWSEDQLKDNLLDILKEQQQNREEREALQKQENYQKQLNFERLARQAKQAISKHEQQMKNLAEQMKELFENLSPRDASTINAIKVDMDKINNILAKSKELFRTSTISQDYSQIEKCQSYNEQAQKLIQDVQKQIDFAKNLISTKEADSLNKKQIIKQINDFLHNKFPNHQLTEIFQEIEDKSSTLQNLVQFMIEDVDNYQSNQEQFIKKLKQIQAIIETKDKLQFENDELLIQVPNLKLSNKTLFELEQIQQQCVDCESIFVSQKDKCDDLLRNLIKLRQKLGDFGIPGIISKYQATFSNANSLYNTCVTLLNQLHRTCPPELSKTLRRLNKLLSNIGQFRDALFSRFNNLSNNINDQNALQVLTELRDIGNNLHQCLNDLKNLEIQLQTIKSQLEERNQSQRMQEVQQKLNEANHQIAECQQQLKQLQEISGAYEGYCSDEQEREVVDRLQRLELKDLEGAMKLIIEFNNEIEDKLTNFENSQIIDEEELNQHLIEIKRIEKQIRRPLNTFEQTDCQTKLALREHEIEELDRKLGQFSILIEKIEEESQVEIEKIYHDTQKQKIISEIHELRNELDEIKQSQCFKLQLKLNEVRMNLAQVQDQSQNMRNLDILKFSKQIKKQIMSILSRAKKARHQFNQLRSRFEGCKLRLRTQPKYVPYKGDDVDKMLADWIHASNCPIPIERLANGYYTFGQKKIYAKITNGKLVVRVGGGYMGIEEFMYYYGAQELNKMLAYEGFSIDEEIDLDKIIMPSEMHIINKFDDGKTVIGLSELKKRFSPMPQRKHSDWSQSPRPASRQSPSRVSTPGMNSRASLRKSSKGDGSPKSHASVKHYSTHMSETLQVKTPSPFITHIAPGNTQGNRRSPKHPNNLSTGVPTSVNQSLLIINPSQIKRAPQVDDSKDYFKRPDMPVKYSMTSLVSEESKENGEQKPTSKIMDLIKERKQQLRLSQLKK